MIYCYMVSGLSLSDIQCDALYYGACWMIKKQKSFCEMTHDDVKGVITSDFQSVAMGGMAGLYFEAEFECDRGECKATFMVREADVIELEKAKKGRPWLDWDDYVRERRYTPSNN